MRPISQVKALGCGFEENAAGHAPEAVGGAEHQRGDEQRNERIGAIEPGSEGDPAVGVSELAPARVHLEHSPEPPAQLNRKHRGGWPWIPALSALAG